VVGSTIGLIEELTMRFAKYVKRVETMYCVTYRLHNRRTVQVPGHEIAPIVSAWLAEVGAHSPLVEDLARAACVGDWAAACAVDNQLSVDVSVAAAA
jgi:hypothetical protein